MHRRSLLGGALATAFAKSAVAAPLTRDDIARYVRDRKYLQTSFGRVALVERGAGPTALFIHAWPLNGLQWRAVMDALRRHRRCVAVDALGLGYTEARADADFSPPAQADMLAEVLDRLRAGRVDVMANDSGGLVAQLLVARHPERVRSLLLTNCDVVGDNPPPSFQPIVKAALNGSLARKFILPQLADVEVARSQSGLGIAYANPQDLSSEAVASYLGPLVSSPSRIEQFHKYTATLGTDFLSAVQPALRGYRQPVAIVWGTADTFFSSMNPEVLSSTFPDIRGVQRVKNGKLYLPEEFPDAIAREAHRLWAIDAG